MRVFAARWKPLKTLLKLILDEVFRRRFGEEGSTSGLFSDCTSAKTSRDSGVRVNLPEATSDSEASMSKIARTCEDENIQEFEVGSKTILPFSSFPLSWTARKLLMWESGTG